jgi:manganese/iron transport system ATP-binding protein
LHLMSALTPTRDPVAPTTGHDGHRHDEAQPVLEAAGLSVDLGGRRVLDDVTFRIVHGERVAIVGPNGAGKTTLLRAIAGLVPIAAGQLRVHGHGIGKPCVAYIAQRATVDWTFPLSVADVVMQGRSGKIGLFRRPRDVDHQVVSESLAAVGLTDLARRPIAALSGGQQQRMFIARALAQEADLFLLDEPFTGLDVRSEQEVLEVLQRLTARGVTILFATHALEVASSSVDRVLLVNHHLVAEGRPLDVLTSEHLSQAYGGHVHVLETSEGRVFIGGTWCPDEDDLLAARVERPGAVDTR